MKIVKEYCYISIPVLSTILLVILYKKNLLDAINLSAEDINTIIGITGTLIGFLLTAITIFLSLPKKNIIMSKVKKYSHHKIFARCIIGGIILSCITIILWLFKVNYIYTVGTFILSVIETIMSAYYIYKLCLYSFD